MDETISERIGCECCGTTDLVGEQTLCDECADEMRGDDCGDHDEVGYDPYSGGYSEDC